MSRLDATLEHGSGWQGFALEHPPLGQASRAAMPHGRVERRTALNPIRLDWKEGMFSTALEQDQLIGRLAELYTFDDYVSVANFLRGNAFLLNVLLEAYDKIQDHFGLHTNVVLEVFTDPEADNSRQLVALIHTSLPLREEVDRLDDFYEGWWLDALSRARYKLHIDLK